MEIKEIIKKRRSELNLTLEEIGEAVGVSKTTVQRWESGNITNLRRDKIEALAGVLRVDPLELVISERKKQSLIITKDTVTFPVVGEIAAGYERVAAEDWTGDTVEIPASYLKGRSKNDFFVLSVCGDSMYPHYQNGDIVLILKQQAYESGDICAVIYDGECATLKKVEKISDGVKLVPINPEYMPKSITGEDCEKIVILGVPRLLIRNI